MEYSEWKIRGLFIEAEIIDGAYKEIAEISAQSTQDEEEANANLIVSAVNACIKLNPKDPLKVAESISDLYEACKQALIHSEIPTDELPSHVIEQLEQAIAKVEGGK